MGAISETCGSDPADIPERGETWQPMEIGLEPNPFVHDAALILRLSAADGMDVDIYDTAGERIRRLVDSRSLSAGEHRIRWDGADQGGAPVPAGVYFGVARSSTGRVSIKLVRESR